MLIGDLNNVAIVIIENLLYQKVSEFSQSVE